eukprot:s169_g21.t1
MITKSFWPRWVRRYSQSSIFQLRVDKRTHLEVQMRLGDLLEGSYDAILNSANETLEGPLFPYFPIGAECESGDVYYQEDVVDGRIHRAGGPALSRLCRKLPELPPSDDPEAPFPSAYTQRCEIGGARLTEVPVESQLAAHCRYVVHAVAPIWAGDLDPSEQERRLRLLSKAYVSAFQATAAAASPVQSLCSSLLGAGAKQFPVDLAARCAVEAVISGSPVELQRLVFVDNRPQCVEHLAKEFSKALEPRENTARFNGEKDASAMLSHILLLSLPPCVPEAMAEKEAADAPDALVFEQDFSQLEKSLEEETWEVDDADDMLELYTPEAKDAEPGAVMVTKGGLASVAELVHQFAGGWKVSRLCMELVCESIDLDSNGTFTVGLAFDDDLEEAVLLACTIRRPRPETKLPREPGDPPEEPEPPKPIALHMNGQVAEEDLGQLPKNIELDMQLSWEERSSRTILLKHKVLESAADEAAPLSTGFYTTDVAFDAAKAVFIRATGSVRVRLLSLKCSCDT